MKSVKACLALGVMVVVCMSMASAMPLNSSARGVIPADLQQLISVDYRAMKDSPTAAALKQQLMAAQENLQQFEGALKGVGINPDKDIDTLALASFRTPKQGVKTIGITTGPFNMKLVIKKLTLAKIKPTKYHTANLYPMDGGFVMTFLDDSTLLFGEPSSVKLGLDASNGEILNLDSNQTMSDMVSSVDAASFWSILDQAGTQNMVRSALGDAAKNRRLRERQEARDGLLLHDGLYQRSELRLDGSDLGFSDCGDALHGDEGGHHVQENQRHAG